MPNLLKRNEFGGIERVCNYPDIYGPYDKKLYGICNGCMSRTKCNHDIFERLAQFEEIGMEPGALKAIAESYKHSVVEVCPHCESENVMIWDVSENGYKAYCPVCGKPMMLCDECIHAEDGLNENANHCDWREDENGKSICFRCRAKGETT